MKKWDSIIKQVYGTPGHAAAFSSAKSIQREIQKSYKISIPLVHIQTWLNANESYTLHKPARIHFERNPIIATHIDNQWQADLLFLPDLASFNKNYKIAILCIDVVSRYAWGELMYSKTGIATADAFEIILKRASPRKPEKLQTDKGKEFLNGSFQKLCKDYEIEFFTTNSDLKAAIAERLIRTIKTKIYQYLDNNNTNTYIDKFQEIIKSYNETYHSSIKMAPKDVTVETTAEVIKNLYGFLWDGPDKILKQDLEIGDFVRISKVRSSLFRKSYKGNWTEEVFKIKSIFYRHPQTMYELTDLNDKKIEGTFYDSEIQKIPIDMSLKEWKIEKIIKSRTIKGQKQHYVKWLGYSDDFNSWIKAEGIKKLV